MTALRIAATVAVLGGLVWVVDFNGFVDSLLQAQMVWLVIAALLLPLNIALETWKWRCLLRANAEATTRDALGSVLAGYALGLFTPGRAGDYIGRVLYLKGDAFQTAVQTGVDRVISMSVYLGAGLAALCLAFGIGLIELSESWLYVTLLGAAVAALLIGLVIKPLLFHRLLSWISASVRWRAGIRFMQTVGPRLSVHLFLLSVLRYVIFTSQLVVLVIAFGGESAIPMMYLCASLVFFVKTMIPAFTFADLGIRETAVVFFFGLLGVEPITALNASLMLFGLNLVIPAIIGAMFVPRLRVSMNIRKSLGTLVGSIAR